MSNPDGFYFSVNKGESLSKISKRYGISHFNELYNHPKNKSFKEKHPDPDLILPGDIIWIPVPSKKQVNAKSGSTNKIIVSKKLHFMLGVEIDPTAGAKTEAEFTIGLPGGGHDPLKGFKEKQVYDSSKLINEGKEFDLNIDISSLQDVTVRIRPFKSWLLNKYDKETGETEFRDSTYPTSEMLAEIYIFKGNKCLTGPSTSEQVLKKMQKTKPGINIILIRVDDSGTSIQDLIIDGITYVKDGTEKIKTSR